MRRRRIMMLFLVSVLGLGLHSLFRSLGASLPTLFPQLVHEERQMSEPLGLVEFGDLLTTQDEEEEAPPPRAIPIKRSGEIVAKPEISPIPIRVSSIPTPQLGYRQISSRFSVPPEILQQVEFWKRIYGVYSSQQILIHDATDLSVVYDVLDFSELKSLAMTERERRTYKENEINRRMREIRSTLPESAQRNLRAQSGLKEEFLRAVKRSGRYLPLFENIFTRYEVPPEITRLVFVESLFHERAQSKVGAAGLWQFMKDTGKKYLVIDRYVDERYDPVIATDAAARLLRHNYELLGSWPLAINAYNSGPANLQKAMSQLGTREIGPIVSKFRSDSYGFASRNFYPSFLAVTEVFENYRYYFGDVVRDEPLQFDQIELPKSVLAGEPSGTFSRK